VPFTNVNVVGTFTDSAGRPAYGTVTLTPSTVFVNGGAAVSAATVFTLNEFGKIPPGSTIPATNDRLTSPTRSYYVVNERVNGKSRTYNMQVRDYDSVVDLGSVVDPYPASVEHGDYRVSIAVPSYFWVTWYNAPEGNHDWERLQAAAPVCKFVICNPASGPGDAVNADWQVQIRRAHAAGLKVLGYVRTDYAGIPLVSVKASIRKYFDWYGVDGIFIDEVPTSSVSLPYFGQLYDYVKNKSRDHTVILNPGTYAVDEAYMSCSDVVMNFEGPASAYSGITFPAWTINYPAHRFWHCIHDVADVTQRDSLIASARVNRAGLLYLTTDTAASGANPYDSLPANPFWQGTVDALRGH
jgi:hypothetical protein